MSTSPVQKFSIFHDIDEQDLKKWHRPYAALFEHHEPVLDVGCGPMYFSDLLRERGIRSVGLDVDPAMVKLANSRGHTAIQGDHLTLADHVAEFSGVHVSHVVEHLWGDELIVLLEGAYQALRPSGLIVLRTPNWGVRFVREHLFWMDHTHKRPYPRQLLDRVLSDIGFVVLETGIEPFGVNDAYVVAAKPPVEQWCELKVHFDPQPQLSIWDRVKRRLRMQLRSFLELD